MLVWALVPLLKHFTNKKNKESKETKGQGKKFKAFRKNHIDKNKEKGSILCKAFILWRGCFRLLCIL